MAHLPNFSVFSAENVMDYSAPDKRSIVGHVQLNETFTVTPFRSFVTVFGGG